MKPGVPGQELSFQWFGCSRKTGGPHPWAGTSSSSVLEKEVGSQTHCKKRDPSKPGLGFEAVFNCLGSPALLLCFVFHCLLDFDLLSRP